MKALVVALGVGVVGAGVVAGVLWRDLDDVHAQNAQLRDRVISLQTAQVAAGVAPAAPSASAAPVTTAEGQVANAEAAAKPAAPPAADKGDALMAGISKVLSTPEGKDMIVAQLRMMLPQQFPDLAKEMGFSKAEEEKFFDLLVSQQAALTGDALGVLNGGMDRAQQQEMQRKVQELQRTQQAELNAMLGSKAPLWQEYQKTLPLRQQVNTLQAVLGEGNALSASQSKSLMTTLAAEQTRIQEDRRNAPRPPPGTAPVNGIEERVRRATEENARLVNAASSQLSPQQLESYKKMLQQQLDTQQRMIQAVMPQGQ